MFRETAVEVKREVEAALIPSGTKVMLQPGTHVFVTQALGNSYTVYVNGNLVRIAGKDGDALGLVILEQPDINAMEGSVEDKVWIQLKTCFDPEIPVNIVDLGLVYACNIFPLGKEDFRVEIVMTLTAPACGMGPVLVGEVEEKTRQINGVKEVKVELVFDPPWDRSMMSDEAKLQLGLL
ncbi:MAG: putative Fe-S cluster assembly protein SufT [Gammaproteobacteria bacterium]|nr:putative Fe-S cluster assembly protein SufT [Gammaproteobacteria bacterium]MCW5582898.1 putative Fe-S cluster assembly protein SufT [Gammaproteobacteria bacterium]